MLAIPKHINAEGLIPFLEQLATHANAAELTVDFTELQRVSPAGLAAFAAFMESRARNRLITHAIGLRECGICDYLRRMNLFRHCALEDSDETFARRDSTGRFVPLEPIGHQVDELGEQIAACIAPGGDDYEHRNAGLYDAAFYLITEMANNVRQHSRGAGFVTAQTTVSDGFIRIAISDCGRGIPGSLADAGFSWAQNLPHEDVIEKALAARVSSKGQPSNEGVGLTLSACLVELMGGFMLIASGRGIVISNSRGLVEKRSLPDGRGFPGTLVAISFRRSESEDFQHKLHIAKELKIPLRAPQNPVIFRA